MVRKVYVIGSGIWDFNNLLLPWFQPNNYAKKNQEKNTKLEINSNIRRLFFFDGYEPFHPFHCIIFYHCRIWKYPNCWTAQVKVVVDQLAVLPIQLFCQISRWFHLPNNLSLMVCFLLFFLSYIHCIFLERKFQRSWI